MTSTDNQQEQNFFLGLMNIIDCELLRVATIQEVADCNHLNDPPILFHRQWWPGMAWIGYGASR